MDEHDDGGGDGTAAVLYGIFTSFTEALDGLDHRLAAMEAALRAGPTDMVERLEKLDERTAALTRAVEAMRVLLESHVDDTAHSLGRRASDAGRRLATDLGLRNRPKQPPER